MVRRHEGLIADSLRPRCLGAVVSVAGVLACQVVWGWPEVVASASGERAPGDVRGGQPVRHERDVNCDGYDDLAVLTSSGAGVMLGGPRRSGDLDRAQALVGGLEVQASGAEDVSIIGDVDGDGLADLGVSAGSGVFIVYGRREAGRIDPAAGGEATELVGVGGWEGRQLSPRAISTATGLQTWSGRPTATGSRVVAARWSARPAA